MAKKVKKAPTPQITVASRIKEYVKSGHDMRTGGDFADALNAKVTDMIDDAARRCESNGRATLRADDL